MQKSIVRTLVIMLFALQLTSCITTHQLNYLQAPKNFIPAYKDTVAYTDYVLKEGDRLYIQVYSIDDKTNVLFNGSGSSGYQLNSANSDNQDLFTYIVLPDGNIHFPMVGDVLLKGKTIRETKALLQNEIKSILPVNSVDVRMVGRTFSIIGAGKSGKFEFPREKVNIFQALAMIGDVGFYTDRSKIKILRESDDGAKIKSFDLRSVDIINSEFYYLEPNDVIFLQPMKEQFYGVTTFWSALATLATTYSFGVIIYKTLK